MWKYQGREERDRAETSEKQQGKNSVWSQNIFTSNAVNKKFRLIKTKLEIVWAVEQQTKMVLLLFINFFLSSLKCDYTVKLLFR